MKYSTLKSYVRVTFLPLALAPFFMACSGTSNSDQVYNAQSCLDKTSQANALTCYNMVAGNNTVAAYLVRCASLLLYEGVSSPSALQTVVTDLTGGGAPISAAASALAFVASAGTGQPSNSIDLAKAADAVSQCTYSNSTGLTTLATLASISTAVSNLTSTVGTSVSQAQIQANAGAIVNAVPQMPALISTSYSQNCTGTISSANQSFCTQYATALSSAGGNSTTAAVTFLQNLH